MKTIKCRVRCQYWVRPDSFEIQVSDDATQDEIDNEMLEAAIDMLAVAPQPPTVKESLTVAGINQCDGCQRCLPESMPGMHRDESGPMTCTKGRYVEPLKELSEDEIDVSLGEVLVFVEKFDRMKHYRNLARAAIAADRRLNGRG